MVFGMRHRGGGDDAPEVLERMIEMKQTTLIMNTLIFTALIPEIAANASDDFSHGASLVLCVTAMCVGFIAVIATVFYLFVAVRIQAAQAAAFLQNKTANFLSAVSMYGFALVCPLMLAYLCFVVYAHLGGTDVSRTAIATIVATQLFGWVLTYLLVQLSHAFNLPIADASSPGGFRPLK